MAQLEAGKTLTRFFEKRAASCVSAVPFFKFGKVAWGDGFVSLVNNVQTIDNPLPDVVPEIIGEFARTEAMYAYDAATGIIKGQATIAKGSLPAGVNAKFTTLYILDGEEGVIALAVGMPVYINQTRGITVEFALQTRRPVA